MPIDKNLENGLQISQKISQKNGNLLKRLTKVELQKDLEEEKIFNYIQENPSELLVPFKNYFFYGANHLISFLLT